MTFPPHTAFEPWTKCFMTVLFALLLLASASASAQERTGTTSSDSIAQPGAMGWSSFTEADRVNLELSEAQLVRLKDMDASFDQRYRALGIEPWTHADYPALNRQRNQSVQDILNSEQYERWARPTSPVPQQPPTIIPDRTPKP